jgi:hypothetical protein
LANNIWVRVSSSPHGPKSIEDTLTGYNPADYKREDPSFRGKYRLGIAEGAQIEGNWFVFIINDNGEPMSRPIMISTTKGAGCNTGTVDFAH